MTTTTGRCSAARPTDPSPCDGPPDAVEIRGAYVSRAREEMTTGTPACEHHGAELLAATAGGRVYPGTAGDDAALRVWYRAHPAPR